MTNLQIVIDFVAQMDAAKVLTVLEVLKKNLSGLGDGIDLESAVNAAVGDVQKMLNSINMDELNAEVKSLQTELNKINVDELDKALKEVDVKGLEDELKGIAGVDLSKGAAGLKAAFSAGIESGKVKAETEQIAQGFLKAKQAAEQLQSTQQTALAQMVASGQQGTEEYKKLEAELSKTEQQVEDFGKAIEAVANRKLAPTDVGAKQFNDAKKASEDLLNSQKGALAQMIASGQQGTDAYKQLEAELGKTEQQVEDFGKAMEAVSNRKLSPIEINAKQFTDAKKGVEDLLGSQKAALANLKVSGKEGTEEYKKLKEEIKKTEVEVEKFAKATDDIAKKDISPVAKFDKFNEQLFSITAVSNSFNEVIAAGTKFQDALLSVQAITGQTDEEMKGLAGSAKDLAEKFGGSASDQLKSFGGILSKFGADVAKQPEALASLADSVNVLSAASGDDAATSMSALTDSMLQFGLLDADNPTKTAENAVKSINALAASAQVGAAEIPQVAASILATGVAAKGANLSLEQTTAAIQVLSVGGKTGSEAGIGLRNVLGLLQKASGPAAEALKEMGTSSKELGELLTTKGLDAALAKVKKGMDTYATDAQRNTALMTIFGTENAASAGILLGNVDKLTSYQADITAAVTEGASNSASAYAQAGVRMNSVSTTIAQGKAVVENAFIGLFDTIGSGAAAAVGSISQIAPTVAGLSGIKTLIPTSVSEGTISKITEITKKVKDMIPPSAVQNATKLMGSITSKVGSLPGLLSKVGPALLNPYALGFAAVAGGLTYFFTQTDKGKAIFAAFEEKIGAFFTKFEPLFKKVGDIAGAYIGVLVEYGRAIYEWIIAPFEIAGAVIEEIANLFTSAGDSAGSSSAAFDAVGTGLDFIANIIDSFADGLSKGVDGFVMLKSILINFIGSSAEVLGAFFEFAKVAINPVNWVNGDAAEAGAKLGATLDAAVRGAIDKTKKQIQADGLDKALTDAVAIKGDVDKAGKLKELSQKFKDAKTDIERQDIAKKIQEQVPGAVKEIGKVVDETGKIITQYDVSADAVKKFADAQEKAANQKLDGNSKKIVDGIKAQADEYEKLKVKQIAQQKAIVDAAAAGKDTTNMEKQFADTYKKAQEQSKKVSEAINKAAVLKIPVSEIELPPNATAEFAGELEKIKTTARQAEVGKAIAETVTLKEDLDKNNKIDGLLAKLGTAKTQAEKDSIARQIQAEMPGAVKAIVTGVDANGQLTTSLQVNTEEVKKNTKESQARLGGDLKKKQADFLSSMKAEGKIYQDNLAKAKSLAAEIKQKKSIGADTSELEKSLTKVQGDVKASKDKVLEFGSSYSKVGLDSKNAVNGIADALGTTKAGAKELVDEQKKMTTEANSTVDAVNELSNAYKEAATNAKSGVDTARSRLSGLEKERQELLKNKDLTSEQRAEEIKRNKEQQDAEIKKGRAQVVEMKNLEAIHKRTEKLISTEDKKTDTFEAAKKKFESENKSLDINQKTSELILSSKIIEEERARNAYDDLIVQNTKLDTIEKQRDAFQEQFKTFVQFKEGGEIVFSTKLKAEQKAELQEKIQTFKTSIAEATNTIKEVELKVNIDKQEYDKKIAELAIKNLEQKITFGLATKDEMTPILQKQLDAIQLLREANYNKGIEIEEKFIAAKAKIVDDASGLQLKALQAAYDAEKSANEQKFVDLKNQEFEQQNKLRANIEDIYKQRVDDFKNFIDSQRAVLNDSNLSVNIRIEQSREQVKRELDRIKQSETAKIKFIATQLEQGVINQEQFDERRSAAIKDARDREAVIERQSREGIERLVLESTQDIIKIETAARSVNAEGRKKSALDSIDKEEQQKLKVIESYKTRGILTDEEIEERKTVLQQSFADKRAAQEEEHRKQLLQIQAQADGQARFLQIARDKEELGRQRDAIAQSLKDKKQQIEDNRALGLDTTVADKEAETLETQLASAEEILSTKGSEIGALASLLQGSVTDTISNIFAGDPQAVADNLRATLGTIAGALKAKLSAFVLDLVLSPGTSAYLAALPFPLNIAAIPLVTLAVNSAIGAVANPIFDQLLSFPTGGKFTEPTLALVGDGARLGGGNTEWLFRDDQLKEVMHSVVMQSSSEAIIEQRRTREAIENLQFLFKVSGEDLLTATNRTNARYSQRSRG
jgi:TP901 family phage tail tape measure protein